MIEIDDSESQEETIVSEHDDNGYSSDDDDNDDSDHIDIEVLLGAPRHDRWIGRQQVTEQEISWQRGLRIDNAVSDATQHQRRPVLFAIVSHNDGTTRYYAWSPPPNNVPLGRDILKTFYLTRTSPRYLTCGAQGGGVNNTNPLAPHQHRQLVDAFLQVLCPRYSSLVHVTQYKQSVRNDSLALLREYFEATELGQLRHCYHYEDEAHCDESVCVDALDDALPLFLWEF